jgi:hypothetical protein
MCLSKYVLNCEQKFYFSCLDPDYPTSGLTVTGLARVYCACIGGRIDESTAVQEKEFVERSVR